MRADCLKKENDLKVYEAKIKDLEQELIHERFEKLHLYEEIEKLKKKTR
jgi:hypothetical protein